VIGGSNYGDKIIQNSDLNQITNHNIFKNMMIYLSAFTFPSDPYTVHSGFIRRESIDGIFILPSYGIKLIVRGFNEPLKITIANGSEKIVEEVCAEKALKVVCYNSNLSDLYESED
jgi:hypothetical protein